MLGDDHLILFSINIDKIPCRRGAARSLKKGTSCGSLTCDLRKVLINNVDTSTLGGCVFKGGTGPWKEVNTDSSLWNLSTKVVTNWRPNFQ